GSQTHQRGLGPQPPRRGLGGRPLILPNHRRNRSPTERLLNKIVTIQPFPLDRKEKFVRLHCARVDGIALSNGTAIIVAIRGFVPPALVGRSNKFGDAREQKFHTVFPAIVALATLLHS